MLPLCAPPPPRLITEWVRTRPAQASGMTVTLANAALPCTVPAMTSGPVTVLLLAWVLATAVPPATSATDAAVAATTPATFVLNCMSPPRFGW